MYTNQLCHVKWEVRNHQDSGIKWGKQCGVISPLLFSLYVDELFLLLKKSDLGCLVGTTYAGAFGYADDIIIIIIIYLA